MTTLLASPTFEEACDILGVRQQDVFATAGVSYEALRDTLYPSMTRKLLVAPGRMARAVLERTFPMLSYMRGCGVVEVRDEDGNLKELRVFANLITQVGDQYYGERAANIASPPAQVTGMQLGTGTTAAAKTGAGAAMVTYITSSAVAIDGSFPTSALSGSSRRIQWKTTWTAGTATNAAITEAVIINQSVATNSGAAAAAVISRVVFTATPKGASDSMAITWNHDLLGA